MLADLAVAARAWANLNPEVFARGPLTRGHVLSARMAERCLWRISASAPKGRGAASSGMYGTFPIVEAVSQLRGHAGERQQAGCDVALCHGSGGTLASQVTAPLGSAATV